MNKKLKQMNKQNKIHNELKAIITKLNYLTGLIKEVNDYNFGDFDVDGTKKEMTKSVLYLERADLLDKYTDIYKNNRDIYDNLCNKKGYIEMQSNVEINEEYVNSLVDYARELYDSNVFVDDWMKALNKESEVRMD